MNTHIYSNYHLNCNRLVNIPTFVAKLVALTSLETTAQSDAKDLCFEYASLSGISGSTVKSETLFEVVMKLWIHNKQFVGILLFEGKLFERSFRFVTQLYQMYVFIGPEIYNASIRNYSRALSKYKSRIHLILLWK
jgi:hypothetical protein